jgi:hypothetical protein
MFLKHKHILKLPTNYKYIEPILNIPEDVEESKDLEEAKESKALEEVEESKVLEETKE